MKTECTSETEQNILANFVSSFMTLMEKNVDLCKSAAVKLELKL